MSGKWNSHALARQNKRWSPIDEKRLVQHTEQDGYDAEQAAVLLGRSPTALRVKKEIMRRSGKWDAILDEMTAPSTDGKVKSDPPPATTTPRIPSDATLDELLALVRTALANGREVHVPSYGMVIRWRENKEQEQSR